MQDQRRHFLKILALTTSTGLAGCSQEGGSDETNDATGSSEQDNPSSDDETEETSDDTDDEDESLDIPQSGTLEIVTADGPLGPDGFFEGDVELQLTDQNGKVLTEQQLLEQCHFNQLQKLAKIDGAVEGRQTLKEFPHNILDHEWRMENIYFPRADMFEGASREEIEDQFKPDEYTGEGNFEERYLDSNYPQLWNLLAHTTLGGPDSGNDYIKAAGVAATEYFAAGKSNNRTFSTKTNDGVHGLTWMIENVSWEPSEDQNSYIIETAPTREKQIIDLGQRGTYPHNQVFTDKKHRGFSRQAWEGIGRWEALTKYENISVEFKARDEFRQALKNPKKNGLRPFSATSILTEYINKQAHPDGHLSEFQNGQITVHPNEIEYEVPPQGSPASKLAVSFRSDTEVRESSSSSEPVEVFQTRVDIDNPVNERISTTITIEATVSEKLVATKEQQITVPANKNEQFYIDVFYVGDLSDSQIESIGDGHSQIRYIIGEYTVNTEQIV